MAIRRRRYRLAAALECSDDVQTAEALVALMNECLSSQESGADDLIETLVQTLERRRRRTRRWCGCAS